MSSLGDYEKWSSHRGFDHDAYNEAYKKHVGEKTAEWLKKQKKITDALRKKYEEDARRKAALERDELGRWRERADAKDPFRLDWMTLEVDLRAKRIVAVDDETGQSAVYTRRQPSVDDECLWVDPEDKITPEGHTPERLMEMWPGGFKVVEEFDPGFEPAHSCEPKTGCVYCRKMGRDQ